jgi:hypothetical protein
MENQTSNFEKYIDNIWDSIRILNIPSSAALFGVLVVFEDSFEGLRQRGGIVRLRQTLDKNIPHIIVSCKNEHKVNLEENNRNDIFSSYNETVAVESLSFASRYDWLEYHLTAYHQGKFFCELKEREIIFKSKSSKQLSRAIMTHTLGKIHEDQALNKDELTKAWNSNDGIIEAMKSMEDTIRGISINKIITRIPDNVFEKFKLHVHATAPKPSIDTKLNMGSFSLEEYYNFWLGLSSLMLAYLQSCDIKYKPTTASNKLSKIIIADKEELASNISQRQSIRFDSCKQIVSEMILDTKVKRPDLQLHPLIPLNETKLLIAPHMIFTSNWEVCLLRNWAVSSPSKYGAVASLKKGKLESELEKIIAEEKVIVKKEKIIHDINTGEEITDVDLVVFDHRDKNLLIVQIKWVIGYDSFQEQTHCEQELQKGISQLKLCKDEVNNNIEHFIHEVFSDTELKKETIENTYYYLIGRGSIGTGIEDDEENIVVLDYDMCLEYLIKKEYGTINDRLQALARYQNNLEKEILDDIAFLPMNIGGYSLKTEGRNSTKFKVKRVVPSFSPKDACLCGSGKAYKDCCKGLDD